MLLTAGLAMIVAGVAVTGAVAAKPWPMRRVVVTGASGFIGSHLRTALREGGAEVHCVSRRQPSSTLRSEQWWQADLTDLESTRRLLRSVEPDTVFNLAAEVRGARDLDGILPTLAGNLHTAVNAMVASAEIGPIRFVQCASMEEPGADEPLAAPGHPYAASKVAVSSYGRMFAALYGLRLVLLRIFMVYGPGETEERHLVPSTILTLLRGDAPRLSSGRRRIDWVYVGDVADALVAAGSAEGLAGQTIDIGSGERTSVREVVERITALVAPSIEPRFGDVPDRALEHERVADVERTRTLLGWSSSTSLDDGLARTVEWYRAQAEAGRAATTVPRHGE
jgi:nucleoside-diphosphate-sugar epimerase